ncbi:MAG: hypothetical protein V2A79_16610 [Planctomycetota bacterium]
MKRTQNHQKKFMVGASVGLVFLYLLASASWADDPSASTPSGSGGSSGGGGGTTASSGRYYWGPLWYVMGVSVCDEETAVAGGADGSALMLYHTRNNTTEWTFLEGRHMYLGPPGLSTRQIVTNTPGDTFATEKGKWTAVPASPQKIDLRLLRVFGYSRLPEDPPPIQHVPFLVGAGWSGPAGAPPVSGAWHRTAEKLLTGMDLKMVRYPGTPEVGYVRFQHPSGGTRVNPGDPDEVYVILGEPSMAPAVEFTQTANCGDYFDDACPIKSPGEVLGDTIGKHDLLPAQCDDETGAAVRAPEVVWRLPASSQGKQVTVRTRGENENLRISAWIRPTQLPTKIACVVGSEPTLTFDAPSGQNGFIVVENALAAPVVVQLEITWK